MKRALLLTMALCALLITGACSSDSGSGASTPASGGGTLNNPYIIDVGTTYAGTVPFVGGSPTGTNPTGVFYRFFTSVTGFYRGTLTNTNGTSDLAYYLFTDNGGGSGTLIAFCDDTFTGDENCTSRTDGLTLNSGFPFFVEVFNWGNTESGFHLLVAVD